MFGGLTTVAFALPSVCPFRFPHLRRGMPVQRQAPGPVYTRSKHPGLRHRQGSPHCTPDRDHLSRPASNGGLGVDRAPRKQRNRTAGPILKLTTTGLGRGLTIERMFGSVKLPPPHGIGMGAHEDRTAPTSSKIWMRCALACPRINVSSCAGSPEPIALSPGATPARATWPTSSRCATGSRVEGPSVDRRGPCTGASAPDLGGVRLGLARYRQSGGAHPVRHS